MVREFGFLPFFSTEIAGFSIDDLTPMEVWDEYLGLGPWLWRDEIAKDKTCIYGKIFGKKTGYVSAERFPHLANYRRNGYDFDARCDEGLVRNDKRIYEIIERHGPTTAPELRRQAMVEPNRTSAFEASLTRFRMMTYLVPVDFLFPRDSFGKKKFSYGTTVYDLPERWLGEEACTSRYYEEPRESFERMAEHLAENSQARTEEH